MEQEISLEEQIRCCKKCGDKFIPTYKTQVLDKKCLSKLGVRSKRKGASNERRFAQKLQGLFDKYELKYRVRRTPASGSFHDLEPGDLLFMGLPDNSVFKRHFELKDCENWLIIEWFKKAEDVEKEGNNRPVVLNIRKPNMSKAYVVVDEDDYIKILIENEIFKHEQKNKKN